MSKWTHDKWVYTAVHHTQTLQYEKNWIRHWKISQEPECSPYFSHLTRRNVTTSYLILCDWQMQAYRVEMYWTLTKEQSILLCALKWRQKYSSYVQDVVNARHVQVCAWPLFSCHIIITMLSSSLTKIWWHLQSCTAPRDKFYIRCSSPNEFC